MIERRQLLLLGVHGLATVTLPRPADAEAYPSRLVRIVVPFPPGGGTDIVARLVGQGLSDRLGQPFVIDNRPGGGSNIGTESVVRAPPDGHTLLLAFSTNVINSTLYDKLPFDFQRDLAPVAGIMRAPSVLLTSSSLPVATLGEFISYARAHPGKLNMASAGNGSPSHVSGELLKMMAGIDLVHVPYRGSGPALTDLLGGRVHALLVNPATSTEHIRAGRVRALGLTGAARSAAMPDLPTVSEVIPGYEASLIYGLVTPKGTPEAIIQRLNSDLNTILSDPAIRTRLAVLDGDVLGGSPADFGALIAAEIKKWAEVINFSGAKPG